MNAQVVAYSAHPEDLSLTLKVECLTCEIEFGWSKDSAAAVDRLVDLANRHNIECHGPRPIQPQHAPGGTP